MYIRLVELPTCRADALDRASLHITYMAVELRTKKRVGWGPMHAQGMGGGGSRGSMHYGEYAYIILHAFLQRCRSLNIF